MVQIFLCGADFNYNTPFFYDLKRLADLDLN